MRYKLTESVLRQLSNSPPESCYVGCLAKGLGLILVDLGCSWCCLLGLGQWEGERGGGWLRWAPGRTLEDQNLIVCLEGSRGLLWGVGQGG